MRMQTEKKIRGKVPDFLKAYTDAQEQGRTVSGVQLRYVPDPEKRVKEKRFFLLQIIIQIERRLILSDLFPLAAII